MFFWHCFGLCVREIWNDLINLSQKRNLNLISAFSGIEFAIHLHIPYDCAYANMKHIWQKFSLKVPSKFMSLFINL